MRSIIEWMKNTYVPWSHVYKRKISNVIDDKSVLLSEQNNCIECVHLNEINDDEIQPAFLLSHKQIEIIETL